MPAIVPAPLARVAALLRCPHCHAPLTPAGAALRCARGHPHDVARDGHVTLRAARGRPVRGDDAAMVAARVAVLEAGHFAPLTAALAAVAAEHGPRVVLDAGAGPGHHLAAVLRALPRADGIALDASLPALRRAARAHPRGAAVGADVWRAIPLRDATVDLALTVFAPRNAAELARVLRPRGMLVVVTPAPGHLRELAALHPVRVAPHKAERLRRGLEPALALAGVARIAWTMRLTRREAADVVRMGPAAHHLGGDFADRLGALPEPLAVTAAVDVHRFVSTARAGQSSTAIASTSIR